MNRFKTTILTSSLLASISIISQTVSAREDLRAVGELTNLRQKFDFNLKRGLEQQIENPIDSKKEKLLKRGELARHKTVKDRIWVSFRDGVYDVTEFVSVHPGGNKILLAAGQAIDPYWSIFSIHLTKETMDLLESYRIGTLLPAEEDDTFSNEQPAGLAELFANEPKRDKSLLVHSERPCNAETNLQDLTTFITPNEKFYVRNHLPVPKINPIEYRLELEGPGIKEGTLFTLDDLKTKFENVTVTATLQCAGNRRKEMHDVKPVKGLQWQSGAISNATWTGVRLRDVIKSAGYSIGDLSLDSFPGDVSHVHFNGAEGYGASIPAQKAFDPRGDVILAFEMNGKPIPADHGFPIRAMVPGTVAARSVKWVSKIVLDSDESMSHWQQRDYRGFNPSKNLTDSDYSKSQSIQEMPVTSAFLLNNEKTLIKEDGYVTVQGYALAGGGKAINRVDVSSNGGLTWVDATLSPPKQPRDKSWAWTQWQAKLPVQDEPELNLVCKAVDSNYNTQPDQFDGIYNVRGVLATAWQRVNAKVVGK